MTKTIACIGCKTTFESLSLGHIFDRFDFIKTKRCLCKECAEFNELSINFLYVRTGMYILLTGTYTESAAKRFIAKEAFNRLGLP